MIFWIGVYLICGVVFAGAVLAKATKVADEHVIAKFVVAMVLLVPIWPFWLVLGIGAGLVED